MFTIFTTFLPSIHISKKRQLTSLAIAFLATFTGNSLAISQSHPSDEPVANGVYLYGESLRPNAIGKEYIVFEKNGNKTIGAFYLPRSEFSCFHGQFKASRLNVTLFDPFDRRKYNFSLALVPDGLTASQQPILGQPTYQPLSKISTNDRQILAACKQQLQTSKWQKGESIRTFTLVIALGYFKITALILTPIATGNLQIYFDLYLDGFSKWVCGNHHGLDRRRHPLRGGVLCLLWENAPSIQHHQGW